jgi:hypothetical protein
MAGLCAVASSRSSNLPSGAGANDIALITDEVVGSCLVLVKIDVEVIEPEVGHHFLKLGVGVDVADEALGSKLLIDDALRIFECERRTLFARD